MDKYKAKELNSIANVVLGDQEVNYKIISTLGWAKLFVEAERPIPEKFRNEFYNELMNENLEYRKDLEESVRWFGVRWSS